MDICYLVTIFTFIGYRISLQLPGGVCFDLDFANGYGFYTSGSYDTAEDGFFTTFEASDAKPGCYREDLWDIWKNYSMDAITDDDGTYCGAEYNMQRDEWYSNPW